MMLKSFISISMLGLLLSSSAFAGASNCDLQVVQAVKAIFKADANADGKVTVKESLAAYDDLDSTIRDLSQIDSKPLRQAIFTYAMKYGKAPANGTSLLKWAAARPFWKYERSGVQVLNAVNALYHCQN